FPAPYAAEPDPRPYWTEVDAFAEALRARLPASIPPMVTCFLLQRGRRLLERRKAASRERLFSLLQAVQDWEREPRMTLKYWADKRSEQYAIRDELMRAYETFRTRAVVPFLEQWRAWLYHAILPFLARVRADYALERRSHGRLNYSDLLLVTAEL